MLVRHPLLKAVLISGSVHGLLLWLTNFPPPKLQSQFLVASLQPVLPDARDLTSSHRSNSKIQPQVLKSDKTVINSKKLETIAPVHSPLTTPFAQVESAVSVATVTPSAQTRGATADALDKLVPAESIPPDEIKAYRLLLAKQARKFRRYPAWARQHGWEGMVELSINYSPLAGGQVRVVKSSGHLSLDDQAVEMIQKAFMATELPSGLKGRSFRLDLPVDYRLHDD